MTVALGKAGRGGSNSPPGISATEETPPGELALRACFERCIFVLAKNSNQNFSQLVDDIHFKNKKCLPALKSTASIAYEKEDK